MMGGFVHKKRGIKVNRKLFELQLRSELISSECLTHGTAGWEWEAKILAWAVSMEDSFSAAPITGEGWISEAAEKIME